MWILRNSRTILELYSDLNSIRHLSNKAAWICKINRSQYLRMYPTTLVLHDGSSLTIRHPEPRRIIKLPLDISTVSEEERLIILENRKPKKKVVIEEEVKDTFDSNKYLKILQRKKVAAKVLMALAQKFVVIPELISLSEEILIRKQIMKVCFYKIRNELE